MDPILAVQSASLSDLLRDSTSPLVLISGIGLVLMVVNARFIHLSDRFRGMLKAHLDSPEDSHLCDEIRILRRRLRLIRNSMFSLCASIVSSSLILVCAVTEAVTGSSHYVAGSVLLLASTGLVGIAGLFLLLDVALSTKALDTESKAAGVR